MTFGERCIRWRHTTRSGNFWLDQGYAKINVFSEDTWQLIRGNENLNKQGEISRDDGSLWRMISALDQQRERERERCEKLLFTINDYLISIVIKIAIIVRKIYKMICKKKNDVPIFVSILFLNSYKYLWSSIINFVFRYLNI